TMAFGDLLLADIRAWREKVYGRMGWTTLFPLFGLDTAEVARGMIAGGLRATVCCVDTQQLDAGFAGRPLDARFLADLPAGVDPCCENGEFPTCLSAGPRVGRALALRRGETVLREDRFAYSDVLIVSD